MKLQTDIVEEQKRSHSKVYTVSKSQAMQAINPRFSHNSVYSMMPCDDAIYMETYDCFRIPNGNIED